MKKTSKVPVKQPKPRGFAAMHPDMQRQIASMGGKRVAKKHGKKHMANIGSIGGANSHMGDGSRKKK